MKVTTCALISLTLALWVNAPVTVNVQSSTFFVATNGSDTNAGTMAAPWRTLRHAVAQLRAGDTLYIRQGTYTGEENLIDSQTATVRSGTSFAGAITIGGYSGEIVTIRPPDGFGGIRLTTGAPSYLIVQDLIIDMMNQTTPGGAGATGVYVGNGAHHNRFQRLEVKNNAGNAFGFSDSNGNSPFNEIRNCLIHHNGNTGGTNQGYGAYISTSDNLIEGNDIHSNGGYGLTLYDNAGTKNVNRNIVRNNRIHDNGMPGGTNYGVVIAWGADNLVYNNLIYRNRGGVQIYSASVNAGVYNNTIYSNTPGEGIVAQYSSATIIRNNIVYANGSAISDLNGDSTMSNNVTTNPNFVNASSGDFRVQTGSAAIDAGMTVGAVTVDMLGVSRPQGIRYDAGAYEFASSAPPKIPSNVHLTSP